MKNLKLPILSLICGSLFCYGTHAQFDQSFSAPFEKSVEKSMSRSQVPGLAISIVYKGEEVYAKAFGVKDVSTGEQLSTNDQFHWASVTKPFVATAAMQLVEEGKLDLDVPVIDYLPYFKLDDPHYKTITSRQLLTHTAGMPDVDDYNWDNPEYDDEALERWVRSLSEKKLLFAPETGHQYSNIGFEVMGDVIAKCSGMSFEEFVAQNIFQPLKMDTATLLVQETEPKNRVSPHTLNRRKPIVRKVWPYNRRHAPSSTLIATVHDLARWGAVNLNHGSLDDVRILQEGAYEQLWKPTVDIAPDRGLSWSLESFDGHRAVAHGGSDRGFRTGVILLPDLDLGIAIATNTDRVSFGTYQKLALRSAIKAVTE